jgi:hypothetical protein
MSPLKPIIPIIVLSLGISGASSVQAERPAPKGEGDRPHGPGDKKGHEDSHRATTIDSVSADSISIKGAKDAKTYKITKDTVFTFKGKTVKADEIKPGMRVSVSAGTDPTVAARITADDPPKESEHPGEHGPGDRGPGGPKGPGDHKPGGDKPKQ